MKDTRLNSTRKTKTTTPREQVFTRTIRPGRSIEARIKGQHFVLSSDSPIDDFSCIRDGKVVAHRRLKFPPRLQARFRDVQDGAMVCVDGGILSVRIQGRLEKLTRVADNLLVGTIRGYRAASLAH